MLVELQAAVFQLGREALQQVRFPGVRGTVPTSVRATGSLEPNVSLPCLSLTRPLVCCRGRIRIEPMLSTRGWEYWKGLLLSTKKWRMRMCCFI
jgi:hypothetical protein